MYKISYTNNLGERVYARITDGTADIESDDIQMLAILADALNRIHMTPDEQWGKDFRVVKVS